LTAAPRSEPMLRKRLVPKMTNAMSKTTMSILVSNISLLRFEGKTNQGANDTPKLL
jgi:hypothetical protein